MRGASQDAEDSFSFCIDDERGSNATVVEIAHLYTFLMDAKSRIFMMVESVTVLGFFPNNR
jgi:hypothetical protein